MSIISNKSVEGLSPIGFYFEVVFFLATVLYSFRQGNPISTYGETISILIQNIILVCLLWSYSNPRASLFTIIQMVCLGAIATAICLVCPIDLLGFSPIPLMLIARVPQVMENHKNKHTGTLSIISLVLSLGGAVARVFTTIIEIGFDISLLATYGLSILVNGTLALQILVYAKNTKKLLKKD